jgi:hypothetical protein
LDLKKFHNSTNINNQFKKEIHNLENVEHVNHYATSNINPRENDETLLHVGKK